MSDRIAEIRARLDKATPGPWMHGVQQGFHWVDTRLDRRVVTIADDVLTDADAELITHAPGDIRWLLDAVGRVRALHRPIPARTRGHQMCEACSDPGFSQAWPCPTLRALGVES
jgi:hypothetical protein